jgi:hypothetical protein
VKPAAVAGEGDQGPPGGVGEAAEAGEAEDGRDDAKDGFAGLLASGVAGFGIVALEPGLNLQTPGLADAARRLRLWRGFGTRGAFGDVGGEPGAVLRRPVLADGAELGGVGITRGAVDRLRPRAGAGRSSGQQQHL